MLRTPRKILAIKLRPLGDTLLMTAALRELRTSYPEAQIDIAVLNRWGAAFDGDPLIRKVWTFERHREPTARAKALARLALQLRQEKYDWVVNFHASPSSATLAFATGCPTRSIHFHNPSVKNRYSTVVIPGKGILKPILERDLDALRGLGIHVPPGRLPRISIQPAELEQTRKRFESLGIQGPVLTLGLGSSRPTKCWPLERYAALALEWCEKTGGAVFALTGPEETPIEAEFLKKVDDLLTGPMPTRAGAKPKAWLRSRITSASSLKLRELFALIASSQVFVGNDAGPKHIAVAVGTPSVTLFGPEDPFEWHPYPADRHPYFYEQGLSCRKDAEPGMPAWCSLIACKQEQHRCLRGFGVDIVLDKALSLLSHPHAPSSRT